MSDRLDIDIGVATAYAYAVDGGYEGTEEEFTALLGNIATDLGYIENLRVEVSTLPAGSSATAAYSEGVLTLGIPRGDKGDKGDTGDTGPTGPAGPAGPTGNGIVSIEKTGTSGLVDTYTITFTNGNTTTFTVTNGEDGTVTPQQMAAAIATALEDYAKIDGYYEDLTAGNAEQLVATVGVTDKVPYNFRTSGGAASIGNRETDKLVGGTIAWNQLNNSWGTTETKQGVTFTKNSDGSWTVTGTAEQQVEKVLGSREFYKDHVYLESLGVADSRIMVYLFGSGVIYGGTYNVHGSIKKAAESGNANMLLYAASGAEFGSGLVVWPQLFDLTQMFGSAVADYVYSLEQANAGAGVAWFRRLFPKAYYAYNAGQLMSVKTSAHEMVGFNQFDELWESGTINSTTGEEEANGSFKRSANKIPVVNAAYYLESSGTCGIRCFSADNSYLGNISAYQTSFTPISGTAYIRVVAANDVAAHPLCVNLSWSGYRNGEYEPYEKHSYALDGSLELRGVPKLDASDRLYYDGDTYGSDGAVTRKYGIVDLGTLSWNGLTINGHVVFGARPDNMDDAVSVTEKANILCAAYDAVSWSDVYSGAKGVCILGGGGSTMLRIYDPNLESMSASQFKEAMSGVQLVYALAAPTAENADPYQNPQIVDDFGTEEYVDTRDVPVPVGHDTFYQNNLRDKLQNAPESPNANGDYIMRRTSNGNAYVALPSAFPSVPSSDGTYVLKATVSGGTTTLAWVAE